MIRAAILALAVAGPAAAQELAEIGIADVRLGVTVVRIQPTDEPGAEAEVVFNNASVNTEHDIGRYEISLDGLTVQVEFGFNVAPGGADSVTVLPPAGYIAEPPVLTVTEGDIGVVYIFAVVS